MPVCTCSARWSATACCSTSTCCASFRASSARKMLEIEAQAHAEAGQPFNLNSPRQIQEILFEKRELPVIKKTPGGHALDRRGRARAARARSSAAEADPRVPRPVEAQVHLYRQAAGDDQPGDRARAHHLRAGGGGDRAAREQRSQPAEHPDPHRGRAGASARRSSRRRAATIVSADYSQIELRIMAHISQDASLLKAFAAGEDIHRATAAEIFGMAPAEVGTRAAALRQGDQLRADLRHVGVRARAPARHRALGGAAVHGPLLRALSRRAALHGRARASRRASAATSRRCSGAGCGCRTSGAAAPARRQGAERAAINAPMQGTAADLIKMAMIARATLARGGAATRPSSSCRCTTSWCWKCPTRSSPLCASLPKLMSGVAELAVPLVVDVGAGPNWDKAH